MTILVINPAGPPKKCTFLLKGPSGGKNDNRSFKTI